MSGEITFTGFSTRALHSGYKPDPQTKARAVPIHPSVAYVFDDIPHAARLFDLEEVGNIYARVTNPTTEALELRLADLEGGVGAIATSSGQAAETLGILSIVHAGDNIVSSTDLYGGTYNLFQYEFPKLGITTRFVDGRDYDGFDAAIDERTKLVFLELIGNPKLDVLDLERITAIAHKHGVPVMVDSTTATPYLNRPFEWGADIVVHSTTKYIGGHGTSLGGVLVDSGTFDWTNGRFPEFTEPNPSYHGVVYSELFGNTAYIVKTRVELLRNFGASPSPFNSFLFLQGLETLALRIERHSQNALAVAQFLKEHPKVSWVNYPGLPGHPSYELAQKYLPKGQSGLVGVGIKGGKAEGVRFIESLQLFSHLVNIGDAKSLVMHPATTSHRQLTPEQQRQTGVTDDYVRLSVGIEDIHDILADLEQALEKV